MRIDRIAKAIAAVLPLLAGSILDGAAAATLKYPYGLAVDQNSGKVYIADPGAGQVAVYNPVSNVVSTFVTVANPFSLAVNSDGIVYAGIVGSNSQINVYNAQGQSINTLPVPPGDSPITMTIDADNILYQAKGNSGNITNPPINCYRNDLGILYAKFQNTQNGSILPYNQLQIQGGYSALPANSRYALAYDHGQVFRLFIRPNTADYNVYETPILLSGHAGDIFANDISVLFQSGLDANSYILRHHIDLLGSAFAAAVDSNHNIFYTDPDGLDIAVTRIGLDASGNLLRAKALLSNLSSAPYGIAFDKTRSRLYVAFAGEHLIRAYTVTYTLQNGAKVPALSSPPMLIQ